MNATSHSFTSTASRLFEPGADVNAINRSNRYSSLHFAVELNQPEILSMLLLRGANFTAETACGKNVIHLTARYASLETLSALMNPDLSNLYLASRDNEGKTAADYLSECCTLLEVDQEMRRSILCITATRISESGCSRIGLGSFTDTSSLRRHRAFDRLQGKILHARTIPRIKYMI